jgi:hypothetical protein
MSRKTEKENRNEARLPLYLTSLFPIDNRNVINANKLPRFIIYRDGSTVIYTVTNREFTEKIFLLLQDEETTKSEAICGGAGRCRADRSKQDEINESDWVIEQSEKVARRGKTFFDLVLDCE